MLQLAVFLNESFESVESVLESIFCSFEADECVKLTNEFEVIVKYKVIYMIAILRPKVKIVALQKKVIL